MELVEAPKRPSPVCGEGPRLLGEHPAPLRDGSLDRHPQTAPPMAARGDGLSAGGCGHATALEGEGQGPGPRLGGEVVGEGF